MRTLKITVQYEGTDFHGWQRQAVERTVQGVLEAALQTIEGERVAVVGAGRTDAGVHAVGQVASTRVSNTLRTEVLQRALNAQLPPDVRVLEVVEAAADFHARRDARLKTYRYRIVTDVVVTPFERRYVWHLPGAFDIAAMRRAAAMLQGRHDFKAFQSVGTICTTTERTIMTSTMSEIEPGRLDYLVAGNGFLRHMVRTMVGTLVEIGRGSQRAGGRGPESRMAAVLASGNRMEAGPTAPAQGLTLLSVEY